MPNKTVNTFEFCVFEFNKKKKIIIKYCTIVFKLHTRVFASPVYHKGGVVHFSVENVVDEGVMLQSAFVSREPSANSVEPPRIRKDFPETWLWEDFDIKK